MRRLALVAGLVGLLAVTADAAVTRIEAARREPFAAGQAFGTVGAYEKVVGRVHGELDPAHPLNRVIVDLDLSPRNARGRVEYATDFYLLRPVAPAGALCNLDGSRVAFASTQAEREGRADPRPSMAERYRDDADYVARVRQAAVALERDRYLLAEDVTRITAQAAAAR
jgi:hypothetical protein